MAKGMSGGSTIGSWAFLVGVILAVILGFFDVVSAGWAAVLVILGLIVGLLNITDEEVKPFLTAGAVLVIVSFMGTTVMAAFPVGARILTAVNMLFVPATIIVALKSVFGLAKK